MNAYRITTTAPLPDCSVFRALLFDGRPEDDRALARPWLQPGDDAVLMSRAAWGLFVVISAHAKCIGRMPNVMLPDYFCSGALGPARDQARLSFYPVRDDLTPDWDACNKMAKAARPDIFVLVHYFGFPNDGPGARAFCDAWNVLLLEDAAHALMPIAGIGSVGDCTIWSLYKHLALPDGAILRVRAGSSLDMHAIRAVLAQSSAPPAGRWIAKRIAQRVIPALAARWTAFPAAFDDDPHELALDETRSMSIPARRILSFIRDRLAEIGRRRRTNYTALMQALCATTMPMPLHLNPPSDWIPYRAVLQARDHDEARRLYSQVRARGSIVETWPDLPPEVIADPETHAVALRLRHTTLAFPIHGDRAPEALIAAYADLKA